MPTSYIFRWAPLSREHAYNMQGAKRLIALYASGIILILPIFKLRHQAQSERFGYREVILKGDPKKLNLHGQTCAVCLEDFKVKDELGVLPCQHAFHRRCVVKWLEVRCVCPMCNKALAGSSEQHQSTGTLLDELV
ncbi:RING finger protein 122-like [Sinocyclocheilus rhinocerous]|uniref:RING finger protein 122-like n=1 Tax=Sinocyclocheilus rhinocerous TaxID=307959 RepID=UPI0007B9ADE9|nr:PREDICTED: RING finger protein 122-like [Sinocyclocheilus rhinocerous]